MRFISKVIRLSNYIRNIMAVSKQKSYKTVKIVCIVEKGRGKYKTLKLGGDQS